MSTMTKLVLGGVTLLVLAVAAGVGGWWFFIREDAELATDPPDIPSELVNATPTPGGDPNADVLTFQIIPEQSEAAYFVDEELASLPLPSTAKGSTNAIEGQLHLTADGTALAPDMTSAFTVDLTALQSDEDRRDNRVQEALGTGQFPTATFTIASAAGFDPALGEGEQQEVTLTGTLDLHGVQQEVTWDVEARREGNLITALATVTFSFADFDISPPNIANFVSVSDEATLQVQLVAQAV